MNTPSIPFVQQVERAAGLDIHKVEIVATISGVGITTETRDFKSTTSSLTELKDWLLANGITHVAMEGTGVCPGNNESAGKKKLENESWEQSGESDSNGMCMGCIQKQRYTPSSQISEIGR